MRRFSGRRRRRVFKRRPRRGRRLRRFSSRKRSGFRRFRRGRGRKLRSRGKITVGLKYERRFYPQTIRPWPFTSQGTGNRTGNNELCDCRYLQWNAPVTGSSGTRGNVVITNSNPWPLAYPPYTPGDLISASSMYALSSNYTWRLSDISTIQIDQPWLRWRQYRIRRIRFYVMPRTTVRTSGSDSLALVSGRPQGGDVAFMCTRYTRAIDDMTKDLQTIPSPSSWNDARLVDTAYYIMSNRLDKRKRVVIRRDFATGGRPVVFKFQPTVNRRVMINRSTQLNGSTQQYDYYDWQTKRIRAPWMPFYSFTRDQNGSAVQSYLSVPHYGMAIALRAMSCTDGTFPIFDTKVSFDVEFRHPVTLGQDSGSQSNKSYLMYADTLGDGVV